MLTGWKKLLDVYLAGFWTTRKSFFNTSQKLTNNWRLKEWKNIERQLNSCPRILYVLLLVVYSSWTLDGNVVANSTYHCLLSLDSLTNSCFIALFIARAKGEPLLPVRRPRITHISTTYSSPCPSLLLMDSSLMKYLRASTNLLLAVRPVLSGIVHDKPAVISWKVMH